MTGYHRVTIALPLRQNFNSVSAQGCVFTREWIIDAAPAAQPILQAMEQAGVSQVGHYEGVYHAWLVSEGYMPTAGACPTEGEIGQHSVVPSLKMQFFVPATMPKDQFDQLLKYVWDIHPWEHPMIEVEKISLIHPS